MTQTHAAHDCRWVEQTLDQPLPDWLEAWNAPWTCRRDSTPNPLLTTDVCTTCPRWQPRTPPLPVRK